MLWQPQWWRRVAEPRRWWWWLWAAHYKVFCLPYFPELLGRFLGEINLRLARHLALASIYIVYITYTAYNWEAEVMFSLDTAAGDSPLQGDSQKCGPTSRRPSPAAIFTFFHSLFVVFSFLFLVLPLVLLAKFLVAGSLLIGSVTCLLICQSSAHDPWSQWQHHRAHSAAVAIKVAPQPDGWSKATVPQENTEEGRKEAGSLGCSICQPAQWTF